MDKLTEILETYYEKRVKIETDFNNKYYCRTEQKVKNSQNN